jgi:hypothetical protein
LIDDQVIATNTMSNIMEHQYEPSTPTLSSMNLPNSSYYSLQSFVLGTLMALCSRFLWHRLSTICSFSIQYSLNPFLEIATYKISLFCLLELLLPLVVLCFAGDVA